jgi:hypothetical protein
VNRARIVSEKKPGPMRPTGRSPGHVLCYWVFRVNGPALIIVCTLGLTHFFCTRVVARGLRPVMNPPHGAARVIVIACMHMPALMIIYTLLYCILIDPGRTEWILEHMDHLLSREFLASLPQCPICALPKPPRAHHCRTCGYCHVRMDHHCPALGQCIALRNHQPFLVLLHWASLSAAIGLMLAIQMYHGAATPRGQRAMLIAPVLMAVLVVMLGGVTIEAMLRARRNRTTIEMISSEPPFARSRYDLGTEENLRQVLGEGWLRRWWPKASNLTGFEWAAIGFDTFLDLPPVTFLPAAF